MKRLKRHPSLFVVIAAYQPSVTIFKPVLMRLFATIHASGVYPVRNSVNRLTGVKVARGYAHTSVSVKHLLTLGTPTFAYAPPSHVFTSHTLIETITHLPPR